MKLPTNFQDLKKVASIEFVVKYWWLWVLIAITIFAFWTRTFPAKYGELQALDPFYAYRMNEYMLSHNLQLPLHDDMRYWPDGVPLRLYGPIVYFYAPVLLYVALMFFGLNMPFLEFAILYPAIMGAFCVFISYGIGREAFNDRKAGLFGAMFLATVPAFISRTSAGFFDKEATGGTFLLLTVYFFIKAYKTNSWKWGFAGGIAAILALGSWGGAQFLIYVIGLFVLVKLILNQYHERLFKSAITILIPAFLSQRYIAHVTSWPFEQVFAIVISALVVIRFLAGRYKFVKDEQMQYLIPGMVILVIVIVLVGSMFSDYLWKIIERAIRLVVLSEKGVIGSTVAEQMPGTWNDVKGRLTINPGRSIIPLGEPFTSIFSVWFLMMAGSLAILYNFYSRKEWILLFPLIWLIMSIQTVYYMVRLVFFLGPPVALVAGYAMSELVNRSMGIKCFRENEGIKKINMLSIPVVVVISLVILTNLATGYVFCNSVGPSFNQWWADAMNYMSEDTPVNSSILSWWDFGYWFQTRGNRPSTADGGNNNGTVNHQIAEWYTADSANWTDFRPWLERKDISYILMDYTLPGKYGAISKIGSNGKQIIGMLQFQQSGAYPQGNRTIIEFKAGQYTIWLPIGTDGNIAGAPIFMMSQGDQYLGKSYINDICTKEYGIVNYPSPEGAKTIPGCIAISAYGLFYIPPEAENSIFTSLMFMDAYGIPDVEKVFPTPDKPNNDLIIIYKLKINESVS